MCLGIGRGKLPPSANNDVPVLVSKWNGSGGGTSQGFNSFRNNSNDANSNPSSGGSFGSRGGGWKRGFGARGARSEFGGGSGAFGSSSDDTSRACYNCNQIGYISCECPESRKVNHGGFNSGDGDRGGFNNDGGFRVSRGGGRGGFSSADRDNRGGGGNCYNCDLPGHYSRECPQQKNPRDSGDSNFFSGGGRGSAQPFERYIPPPAPTTEDDIFGEAVSKGENFGKYHRTQVKCTPEVKPIEFYEEAYLATQVLLNIRRAHFEEPTPVQRYTIPCIRQQDDIMACAQTGSGKTAAFLLPIISNLLEFHPDELLENNHPPSPLCLIISPTRELALQIEREARKFAYQTPVIICSAIGGDDMFSVSDRLREGCHILSATIGRLRNMVEKGRISLRKVKYFVLDQADQMLTTWFATNIRKLEDLGLPPEDERFTSMFSATFPADIQNLAKHFLRKNFIFLIVDTPGSANEDIAQSIEEVSQANKKDRLFQLLEQNLKFERCLIFVETNRSADYINALLSERKLMSTILHNERTQKQRSEAIQQFTNGKCTILVATSVAAHGLDFPLVGYVVNYDLPDSIDVYIHRIGRTGRAGHLGKSISFFDPERDSDRRIAPDLILKLSEVGQEVPEFLQKYADDGGYGARNTDMRFENPQLDSQTQAANPSGDTAPDGGAEVCYDLIVF